MALLIHEVAEATELSRDTIRKCEKRGFISSERAVNNWRRYAPEVVDRLKRLYSQGNTKSKLARKINDGTEPRRPAA
jgi:DNA-binding transcriptional MerR regulator